MDPHTKDAPRLHVHGWGGDGGQHLHLPPAVWAPRLTPYDPPKASSLPQLKTGFLS